eukprot:s684_g6.t1
MTWLWICVETSVAQSDAVARAKHVVSTLGEDHIQTALSTGNPWRELKWLANQQRPPLALIKPSELQASIEKKGGTFQVGNKRQKQNRGAKGQSKGTKLPQQLDASVLRVEHGLFQSAKGQPLSQVPLSGVGPNVSGVVVVNQAMAEPYLRANKCLSTGALAFLVVDQTDSNSTTLPWSSVRVPLVCSVNSEPLLVDGLLYQFGAIPVERSPTNGGCEVQSVATCVVKALVFRDMTKEAWSQVCAHPLKHIFSKVCPLQPCDDEECTGCEAWHSTPQFPIDTPVLEVWGKQWMRLSYQFCPSEQADLFGVHLRIPDTLQIQVQAFSGFEGVFLEPRSLCGKKPSELFHVIWMPRADLSQLTLQRQTVPAICGLARMGHKLGLRCLSGDAAQVYAVLKPGQVFLPQGRKQSYLVGPFEYGTLKSSVAAALAASGWVARPVQPVGAKDHVQGLMFRVQSVDPPPAKVLHMSHGDVVVTSETVDAATAPSKPRIVASPATVAVATQDKEVDHLQIDDPWAPKPKSAKGPVTFQLGSPLEDMEQRVVAAVMAQIPKSNMEVDEEPGDHSRVTQLEQQVLDLQHQTQALGQQVRSNAQEHSQQILEVQNQVHKQGTHFEAAIQAQASQLHGFQESFQEQFRQQVTHQQTMLDSIFQKQMAQFESLLIKRPRQE